MIPINFLYGKLEKEVIGEVFAIGIHSAMQTIFKCIVK